MHGKFVGIPQTLTPNSDYAGVVTLTPNSDYAGVVTLTPNSHSRVVLQ